MSIINTLETFATIAGVSFAIIGFLLIGFIIFAPMVVRYKRNKRQKEYNRNLYLRDLQLELTKRNRQREHEKLAQCSEYQWLSYLVRYGEQDESVIEDYFNRSAV